MQTEREYYIFTFGCGQLNEGKYVKVYGDRYESRMKMVRQFGDKWAFQYSAKEWEQWMTEKPAYVPAETQLCIIP